MNSIYRGTVSIGYLPLFISSFLFLFYLLLSSCSFIRGDSDSILSSHLQNEINVQIHMERPILSPDLRRAPTIIRFVLNEEDNMSVLPIGKVVDGAARPSIIHKRRASDTKPDRAEKPTVVDPVEESSHSAEVFRKQRSIAATSNSSTPGSRRQKPKHPPTASISSDVFVVPSCQLTTSPPEPDPDRVRPAVHSEPPASDRLSTVGVAEPDLVMVYESEVVNNADEDEPHSIAISETRNRSTRADSDLNLSLDISADEPCLMAGKW